MVRLSQARGAYDRSNFQRGAAMSGTFEQARDFFTQGLAHYQARRYTDAERCFAASAALLPGRVSTLTNLGAVRLKLGKPQDAADVLDEALAREPDNIEALGHRATALAELGDHRQALECVERVLALDAGLGQAWSLRGQLLKALGRADEAAASFDEAIARGADAELNRYYRAALTGDVPPTAPRHYVQSLFDTYAEGFDEHLVQVLHYQAPQVLAQGLEAMGRRFARALDLGCGTGLCGPLVRPMAKVLHGVDLSATMVQRATGLGVYDQVVQSDLVAYLQQAETGSTWPSPPTSSSTSARWSRCSRAWRGCWSPAGCSASRWSAHPRARTSRCSPACATRIRARTSGGWPRSRGSTCARFPSTPSAKTSGCRFRACISG
jgi:predicted TPR repeat methyltransferase